MFIKKLKGPHAVTLPDGSVMTRADLPSPTTRRWVASRKAAIVRAVRFGLIHEDEARDTYGLSDEELHAWQAAMEAFGEAALKTTATQRYRQP